MNNQTFGPPKPQPPVMFLDFDGVLHPSLAAPEELFSGAQDLGCLLAARDVRIVISSSWRFQHPLPSLRQLLPPAIGAKVIDVTGPAFIGKWARWQEVSSWATRHRVHDWRALDDSAFEFPPNFPQLIRCNGATGVGRPELLQIQEWLDASANLHACKS